MSLDIYVTQRFSVDVSNATAPYLYHHGSNGSMSVALRVRFQSDPLL